MRQGRPLSNSEAEKIIRLLRDTDMTMAAIAKAMGCNRSTVARINQRHNIREYGKRRGTWQQLQTKR
jgi:IS30 family transposase